MADDAGNLLQNVSVLLAEGNAILGNIAAETLQAAHASVTLVTNGEAAVDEARKRIYDVILLDIQMPIMDGIAVTRILRALEEYKSVPVIALTADTSLRVKNFCLAAGLTDFISKPFVPEALLQTIARHCTGSWKAGEGMDSSGAASNPGVGTRLPEFIEGINIEVGLGYSAGRESLYLKMLRRFLETYGNNQEELRSAIATGSLDRAYRFVHSMKSIAALIGAVALADAAKVLEQGVRKRGKETFELELLADTFEDRLAEVIRGVTSALESIDHLAQ